MQRIHGQVLCCQLKVNHLSIDKSGVSTLRDWVTLHAVEWEEVGSLGAGCLFGEVAAGTLGHVDSG